MIREKLEAFGSLGGTGGSLAWGELFLLWQVVPLGRGQGYQTQAQRANQAKDSRGQVDR